MKGEALKAWRQASEYPLNKLAMILGVNQDTIRNWERGRSRIPEDALPRLAAVMAGTHVEAEAIDLSGVPELDMIEELRLRAKARASMESLESMGEE